MRADKMTNQPQKMVYRLVLTGGKSYQIFLFLSDLELFKEIIIRFNVQWRTADVTKSKYDGTLQWRLANQHVDIISCVLINQTYKQLLFYITGTYYIHHN